MEANSGLGQVSSLPRSSKQREQLTCELLATGDRFSWQLRIGDTLNAHISMKSLLSVARLYRESRVGEEH